MKTLHIDLKEHSYNIHIGSGLLDRAGELIRQIHSGSQVIILADETPWKLYGDRLKQSLNQAGFHAAVFHMASGEQSKSMTVLEELLDFMAASKLTRSSLLIVFGGGVAGDLGGFAAASYMRGIDFVQIPTTLLSQVDSSVGGKTAVNLKSGKNLVGAFWQPRLVISDTGLLTSLSDREFAGGMAEVIKYGAIFDREFFHFLEGCPDRASLMEKMPDIVHRCCDLKRMVVEEDERDTGRRMLLNFGHTFGHALETIGNYERYIHGEGVALGMLQAVSYGVRIGKTPSHILEPLTNLCKACGLPVTTDIPSADLVDHMTIDKKADGTKIRLILLEELGKAYVEIVTKEQLSSVMADTLTIDTFPSGQVVLPPSKSVAHRALIAAALSGGGTISHTGTNEDIQATIRCLSVLGAKLSQITNREFGAADNWRVDAGLPVRIQEPLTLDCGESGSTLRFLIPLAALYGADITFTGHGRLMERPLDVYEHCMRGKGVTFTRGDNQLTVHGPLEGGIFRLPGDVSSQFITGLLLALPLLPDDSMVIVQTSLQSASYVDLTLDVLKEYGITIHNDNHQTYFIPGNQSYKVRDYSVEADFSGAAFFLAAAALGRPLELMGLNTNSVQGDRAFLNLLKDAGYELDNGPNGGIVVVKNTIDNDLTGAVRRPAPLTVDVGDIPDLVPPLAALLAFGNGESRIENAGRLRIKESDRLTTVTRQLNNLGADVTEGEDHLIIRGKASLSGGTCSGENDHRIAMMCGVAAIGCENPVTLSDYKCVKKSYPDFWNDFMKEDSR